MGCVDDLPMTGRRKRETANGGLDLVSATVENKTNPHLLLPRPIHHYHLFCHAHGGVFCVYAHNKHWTEQSVNMRALPPNEVAAEREIKRSAAVRGQSG